MLAFSSDAGVESTGALVSSDFSSTGAGVGSGADSEIGASVSFFSST